MTHASRGQLIVALVRRDLRQVHRQRLASLLLVAVILLFFGIFLFSAARSTLSACGVPDWTGDPLRKCTESAATLRVTISVDPPSGEAPLLVTFTPVISGGMAPYTYSWTFGDGTDSTAAAPTHTYADPGVPVTRVKVIDAAQAEVWSGFVSTVVLPPGAPDLRAGMSTNFSEGGTPAAVAFGATVVGGLPGQPPQTRFALPPDAVEPCQRGFVPFQALGQRQRPQLQQRRPPRQGLPDLPEQQDLRGPQEEEAVTLLPVGQELHGVQKPRLFLDFVQDHQLGPVVEAAHGVGRQAEALVGIVKGEIDGGGLQEPREEVPHQGGLPGLAGAREDRDGPPGQAAAQEGEEPAGVKCHPQRIAVLLQTFKDILQRSGYQ